MQRLNNHSGKTLIIFLSVISVLLLSLTVISLFFFTKESERRLARDEEIEHLAGLRSELQEKLEETEKKRHILEEKMEEADERINNLLDDLELEKGLREEIKNENISLKTALSNENEEKERLRQRFEEEFDELQEKYQSLREYTASLEDRNKELSREMAALKKDLREQESRQQTVSAKTDQEKTASTSPGTTESVFSSKETASKPAGLIPEGKVLSIDRSNNFLIFDIGKEHGVIEGLVMSIYHDGKYLGDVRVSRVQEDMAAADTIPPLSIRRVQIDDRVVVKQ